MACQVKRGVGEWSQGRPNYKSDPPILSLFGYIIVVNLALLFIGADKESWSGDRGTPGGFITPLDDHHEWHRKIDNKCMGSYFDFLEYFKKLNDMIQPNY